MRTLGYAAIPTAQPVCSHIRRSEVRIRHQDHRWHTSTHVGVRTGIRRRDAVSTQPRYCRDIARISPGLSWTHAHQGIFGGRRALDHAERRGQITSKRDVGSTGMRYSLDRIYQHRSRHPDGGPDGPLPATAVSVRLPEGRIVVPVDFRRAIESGQNGTGLIRMPGGVWCIVAQGTGVVAFPTEEVTTYKSGDRQGELLLGSVDRPVLHGHRVRGHGWLGRGLASAPSPNVVGTTGGLTSELGGGDRCSCAPTHSWLLAAHDAIPGGVRYQFTYGLCKAWGHPASNID